VPAPSGNGEWLVLDVDPPAPGLGPPIDVIVVAPRHEDEQLGVGEPLHVHILVPYDPDAIGGPTIEEDQLEHVAWGGLYATADEARDRYESLRRSDEATR
jgi:hypothetical protein